MPPRASWSAVPWPDYAAARPRLAACAFLTLRRRARFCADVGLSFSGTLGRSFASNRSPRTRTRGEPNVSNRRLASSLSGTSLRPCLWAWSLPISHFSVLQEPLPRLPATRSMPPFSPASCVRKVVNPVLDLTSIWKKWPPPFVAGLARLRPLGWARARARDDIARHAPWAFLTFARAAAVCLLLAIVNLRSIAVHRQRPTSSSLGQQQGCGSVPARPARRACPISKGRARPSGAVPGTLSRPTQGTGLRRRRCPMRHECCSREGATPSAGLCGRRAPRSRRSPSRRGNMRVSEAMTHDVRIANPNEPIRQAARTMAEIDAGVLPVGENDRLVGMITDRDIAVRAVAAGLAPDTPVRKVMPDDVRDCLDAHETR